MQKRTTIVKNSIEREQITQWDFGELPKTITFHRNGRDWIGYPALVDHNDCAAIRVLDTEEAANELMRAGVKRLLHLSLKEQIKQLEKTYLDSKLRQCNLQIV